MYGSRGVLFEGPALSSDLIKSGNRREKSMLGERNFQKLSSPPSHSEARVILIPAREQLQTYWTPRLKEKDLASSKY